MKPILTRVEQPSSTNDVVRELIERGCADGRGVWSSDQTAGRGRLGRSWVCPPRKGVALSIGLVGPQYQPKMLLTPLATGVAVVRACAEVAGLDAQLKWPNDVLLDGRKAAGILCEGVTRDGRFLGIVIGIGLNVNSTADDMPDDLRETATSLVTAGADELDLAMVAGRLFDSVLQETLTLQRDEVGVLSRWRARDATIGRAVRIGDAVGTADGITDDGALRVRTTGGVVEVRSGEVVWASSRET